MDSREPEKTIVVVDPSNASDEVDQDREYGCKYCQKKFSNKQALGGHQNAHKLERAMEKNVREIQQNHFGYFGGAVAYPGMSGPFLGSYNRSHEYLNRTMYRAAYPNHQIHNHFRHNPARPVLGFNNVYPTTGMVAPVGRMPSAPRAPFPGQTSLPNQGGFNARFFPLEPASPNGGRPRPDSNGSTHPVEDSGLDLTLKL